MQGFLREHLHECGVTSENDCPASDAELMEWIGAGINYGRRSLREQPETVQRIFTEAGVKTLPSGLRVAQKTVAAVGSLQPAALLPAIKSWQKAVYGSNEPYFYGQCVERVALSADFAVWIPWGLSQPTQPRRQFHRKAAKSHLGLSDA